MRLKIRSRVGTSNWDGYATKWISAVNRDPKEKYNKIGLKLAQKSTIFNKKQEIKKTSIAQAFNKLSAWV